MALFVERSYLNEFLIIRKVVHMWPDHLRTYVLSHLHYSD